MTDIPASTAPERKQLAPPVDQTGALGWVRRNLFSSWGNGITTVVLIAFLLLFRDRPVAAAASSTP